MNAFALVLLCLQDPEPLTLAPEKALETITKSEITDHIRFLASDEMAGRDTPSPELVKTAEYVAEHFKKAGLRPAGDDGTFLKWWKVGREGRAPNCVGVLEGSDPKLKDEYVVLGGHMDHVGTQGGEVHNGADDNASGTTGVLELAEAFGSLKERPKRSMIFLTFGGEEKGLLGSAAYCRKPSFPHEKTVAMINFDMIGRSQGGYLFLGGTGTSPTWKDLIESHNKKYGFTLETGSGGMAPSDNSNFYQKGIPVLFFFTHIHEDYHGPGDDLEKINADAEEKIVRMAFEMVREIADLPRRPAFTKDDSMALPKDFHKRMADRFGGGRSGGGVRLGVNLDEKDEGLVIAGLSEGDPAERAGIREGDVLLQIGEQAVQSVSDVRKILRKHKPGDRVTVTVLREGGKKSFEVEFSR